MSYCWLIKSRQISLKSLFVLVNDGKYIPSFIQIFGSLGWFKGQFAGHPAKFHGKNHGFL